MNRRNLLLACAALAAGGVPALAMPHAPSIIRRRLGPEARSIVFTPAELRKMRRPLVLRAGGNALWIESVSWTDATGAGRMIAVRRNLPNLGRFVLPDMGQPTALAIAVTTLPLAFRETRVELTEVTIINWAAHSYE